MLIEKQITMEWNGRIKKYYESIGYVFTKYGDKFVINSKDLSKGSNIIVAVQCDFCDKKIEKPFYSYVSKRKNSNYDCCDDSTCIQKKIKKTFIDKYGVDNISQLPYIKDIVKSSNMRKFGVEYYSQTEESKNRVRDTQIKKYGNWFTTTDEYKKKYRNTCLEKYGTEYVMQSEEVKKKCVETCNENFGVDYPMQSKQVMNKSRITSLSKYGTIHPMKNEVIKENLAKTKMNNGFNNLNNLYPIINGVYASKPQVELGNFLKGKINILVSGKFVDILLDDNIIIEYDGGGHTLQVKTKKISKEVFYEEEKKFEIRAINNGYRLVRIKNEKDKTFDFNNIKNLIDNFKNEEKKYLLIDIS